MARLRIKLLLAFLLLGILVSCNPQETGSSSSSGNSSINSSELSLQESSTNSESSKESSHGGIFITSDSEGSEFGDISLL